MNPIVFIPLTQGKVAVVDFDDFELVRPFKWCASKATTHPDSTYYARRGVTKKAGSKTTIRMHNSITGKLHIDHKNGNGLDNRRSNLRALTQGQNLRSFSLKPVGRRTSQFRGVSWCAEKNKWAAYIGQSKGRYIGRFDSQGEAARAWDAAALKLGFSEEALNFPPPRSEDFVVL
jgi:hypothetical protein